ncbi:maestro heat-like repeat-containing protein family member 6 [Vidua chalybeata]|uniref:maestro heat-like repeat-containing protein family member 6 n=1 Tax=Vidua chalybeata TaxID=81927 RepID=UPI0023A7EEE2|nr:maestro heat-like repeat-containing protein family member 6 isoform X1 [Vidua chalybeata]XP_053803586.1 maestro heat-like repeat-containing protein family member 6 [Vidua chalybeata]XP_053803992.1 maestro heat-like repeat-containing protein family member 6 [Vidua chalybeata]XP_053804001.1 maestro heat-like repeat-containing protein family member 6 [Vidua chalybeata]
MAARFLSVFKVIRGKKKKDPGADPAQEHEEAEQFQTLQDDAALDRTQEQEPARGRFRKSLKMFRQFLRIQRRKTGSTAAAGAAEPDSGLTELQAEPDGSPGSAECSEDSETSETETWAKALLTPMTEDVAITNHDKEETQGITTTDTSPDSLEHSEDSEVAMNDHRAKADMALTEDVAIRNTKTRETKGITTTDTNPDSMEHLEDSEAAMNDHRAKADMALTEDVAITNANTAETQGLANTDTTPTPTLSQELIFDCFKEPCVSSHQQQQVPAKVENIHQSLMSHVSVDARLQTDIVRLAEEHPADVVLTLLRCAPTCDRAAAMMWRAIGSSGPALENALPTLLCVMEDWPLHRMCTSDGDNKDLFALAATLVIWLIVQVPECHKAIILYSSRLFVALLFHVVITTQQMPPEEVDNFWSACQEKHRLPSKPNRFAVQAMKALLCRLQCDHVVVAMERKRGWDTLLCAHTQHYAVGLLAREMLRGLIPLCSRIALHLLRQLSREEPCWDLPALAFLVEVLECLDTTKCGDSMLEIMSRHLQSECRERRRLALRGLVVLSKDPSMARRMCSVSQSLLELLGDEDREVVSMSLHVFTNVLQHKDILVSSTTAPKLAEALLLLFEHDNSHVQLLSIQLMHKMMDLVVDEGKKPMKKILSQGLLPLFLYCHVENWQVAKASRETLLRVSKFLKRWDLEQLVEKEQLSKFAEVLLAEDRSRAAEHLRRARPYLQSPQEPLQEAAIRFMVTAGRYLRKQQEETQFIYKALQALWRDDSPSQTNIVVQDTFSERAAEVAQKNQCLHQASKCHGR